MSVLDSLLPIVVWTGVNLVLPLLPIGLVRLVFWIKTTPKGFLDIVGDGQICFVCSALSVGTMNDALRVKDTVSDGALTLTMVLLAFCLIISSAVFMLAAVENDVDDRAIRLKISKISLCMTVVIGSIVVLIRHALDLFDHF